MVVYDRERERRDDAVYAEHKAAVARGEERVLRRTSTGELHSYPGDEIGFTPGRGQAQVSSWWGMAILSAFGCLGFVASVAMFLSPLLHGAGPSWGALWVVGLAGFIAWYGFNLSKDEYKAMRIRKQRGAPKPGSGYVDVDLLELGRPRS
ncbi:hypothetical protein [Paenarthrobacter sp. FR1]|uniref:hypothetical protein n=1 Tax=Paenarthrobacter sp. FR1 TaxID=3439548 RepID=UPI003DA5645B